MILNSIEITNHQIIEEQVGSYRSQDSDELIVELASLVAPTSVHFSGSK